MYVPGDIIVWRERAREHKEIRVHLMICALPSNAYRIGGWSALNENGEIIFLTDHNLLNHNVFIDVKNIKDVKEKMRKINLCLT